MVARATHEEEWFKLSPQQRAAWAGFIRAHASIVKELDAELQAVHGLPLSSYDVFALDLAINLPTPALSQDRQKSLGRTWR